MWQNINSACHSRGSCKNGEMEMQMELELEMELELKLETALVVNAADNPAHHLQQQQRLWQWQQQQQQQQRLLGVSSLHTNAILKNHPKPVGNI